MKISKKDKMILLTLLFVLILGVFLMYGLIPAFDELKEIQAKETELQATYDKLIREYNSKKPDNKIQQMENLLMGYYLNEDENFAQVDNEIEAYLNFVDICNMEILENLYSYTIFISDNINDQSKTMQYENIKIDNLDKENSPSLLYAATDFTFSSKDLDEASQILEYFLQNSSILVTNASLSIDKNEYIGSVSIKKYYLEKTKNIPLPLLEDPKDELVLINVSDAPLVYPPDTTKGTITFEEVSHAEYYEVYEVFINEETEAVFSKKPIITNIRKENNDDMSNQITFNYLNKLTPSEEGNPHYYVLVAVGNYEKYWFSEPTEGNVYYRTIMSQYLVNNKFTV